VDSFLRLEHSALL